MAQQLLFILRQSPDWHALANDFRQGLQIDPARFRPPGPIPGFPGNIVQLVGQWNATMGVDFFSVRSRLKEMCEDSIAQIPGARRISYRDADNVGPGNEELVAFYHDDDDWFAPNMAEILQEVLPDSYDVCVFPLVRISADTSTLVRQVGKSAAVVIGKPRPFSHRYQSNNYGINGRVSDRERLVGMKDHVEASEYANSHGLRDVYIDRIISATAKTPCSAQAVAQIFRDPTKARDHVRLYVDNLKALKIPANLPWIANRVEKLIDLFSEALNAARPVTANRPNLGKQALNLFHLGAAAPAAAPARNAETVGFANANQSKPNAPNQPQRHGGIRYLEFIKFLAQQIQPSSYFEIGTRTGASLGQVDCDAICVDPAFAVGTNVIKKRQRSFFFQMTSDDFFASYDVKQFFPKGIDLAFLDGMHQFEFLLRDFINAEKACRPDSVIFLHDCLPFSKNITARIQTPGAWAGDVWKVLPILKKFRPDIKIVMFDCPPTGLVACTNLDPNSSVLSEVYDQVVAKYLDVTDLPLDLHTMYPRGDSKALSEHPESVGRILPVSATGALSMGASAVAAIG
jgi:hypothetical protein